MSVKIMGLVWDSDLPRNQKFILLAYADHADHEGGGIYPSVGRTAWKTGYEERMVQRITKQLVKTGVLVRDGKGKMGTNRYRIDLEKLSIRPAYNPSSDIRGDILPPLDNLGGDILPPQNAQKVRSGGDILPPESSCNRPLTVMGATPAKTQTGDEDLDTFFHQTQMTPVNGIPSTGVSLHQRIKDNDPHLLMTALGVTAQSNASLGKKRIKDSNWRIYSDRIEIAMAAWLDVTHYEVPASKSERGKWLTGVKDHLEKFPADDLPNLYRLAWEEYKPAILAGDIDITHPAALTNKMVAINTRPTSSPGYNHDEDPSVKMSRGWMPEFRRKDEPQ